MSKLHLREGWWPDKKPGWLLLTSSDLDHLMETICKSRPYYVAGGWILTPSDAALVLNAMDESAFCRLCAQKKHCNYVISQITSLDDVPFLFLTVRKGETWTAGDYEAFRRNEGERRTWGTQEAGKHETQDGNFFEVPINEIFEEFARFDPKKAAGDFFQWARDLGAAAKGPSQERLMALQIMGLGAHATQEQIAAAIKKKVFETHPDRGGDPEALKRVLWAKSVLAP